MSHDNNFKSKVRNFAYAGLLLGTLLLTTSTVAIPADDGKSETIDATAMGTSTQLGKTVSVKITILKYSTQEDRQAFIEAYKKGQNKGLVDALEKAPSVGSIAITGTVGNQLAYISVTKTETGRRIRFAANRWIRFGEAYRNTPSTAYNLTAGEININDADNKKSEGVLYPASQLIVNKDGQLEFQLRKNPWKLVNIIDWNGAGK
ncbi:MAG: hypothetical protein WBW33_19965 [Bryobacteraceae bacterium]